MASHEEVVTARLERLAGLTVCDAPPKVRTMLCNDELARISQAARDWLAAEPCPRAATASTAELHAMMGSGDLHTVLAALHADLDRGGIPLYRGVLMSWVAKRFPEGVRPVSL